MRRVIFEEKGGPEVLKFETLGLPSPATGKVRIKIKAIGLNRYESMFRQGVYVVPPELPSAIGAEAVVSQARRKSIWSVTPEPGRIIQ